MIRSNAQSLLGVYNIFILLVNKLESAILILSILTMALNNIANVICRVAFNQSLYFTEELNSILIILITFAGTSYGARRGSHIRMSAMVDMFNHRYQKLVVIFSTFFTSFCIFAISYFSAEYIMWIAPKGKILPAMQIPVYLTYLWVPVSLSLTGLEYFTTGVKNLFSRTIFIASQVTMNEIDNANQY